MNSAVPGTLVTRPFTDANLWQLGLEQHWEELQRILAPITRDDFAVTRLENRLLIDDIRQRFDYSKDGDGNTILNTILMTNAADKNRMSDVVELVLSVGVHPDVPNNNRRRPAHIVGQEALVELVPMIYACRLDMGALNSNNLTPLTAAQATYVSKRQKPTAARRPKRSPYSSTR
jgi:hypothetical protein